MEDFDDHDIFSEKTRSLRKKRQTETMFERQRPTIYEPKDGTKQQIQHVTNNGSFGAGAQKRVAIHKRTMFTKKRSNSVKILTNVQRKQVARQQETVEEKLGKIPLAEDEQFLEAVKDQLYELKKRLRHEVL